MMTEFPDELKAHNIKGDMRLEGATLVPMDDIAMKTPEQIAAEAAKRIRIHPSLLESAILAALTEYGAELEEKLRLSQNLVHDKEYAIEELHELAYCETEVGDMLYRDIADDLRETIVAKDQRIAELERHIRYLQAGNNLHCAHRHIGNGNRNYAITVLTLLNQVENMGFVEIEKHDDLNKIIMEMREKLDTDFRRAAEEAEDGDKD